MNRIEYDSQENHKTTYTKKSSDNGLRLSKKAPLSAFFKYRKPDFSPIFLGFWAFIRYARFHFLYGFLYFLIHLG